MTELESEASGCSYVSASAQLVLLLFLLLGVHPLHVCDVHVLTGYSL